jgi:hypothetical protein
LKPTITVTESGDLHFLQTAIDNLENAKVYVGIPEKTTSRKGEKITNAGLMYIHTNGSEVMHIPARPVIEPAIEAPDNKERIAATLGAAMTAELNGEHATAVENIRKAGTQGANAAKRWFTDPRNNWAPNAPSTIAAKGSARPLIDKGELRRAITHVEEL